MGINKRLSGFTLIETIVVITIISLTLPAIFAIVSGIARQQLKVYRISIVKNEGDYILNLLTNTIRNSAVNIYSDSPPTTEQCQTAPSSYLQKSKMAFKDQLGNWFAFSFSGNSVSSSSANPTIQLNSSKVLISGSIGCKRSFLFSNPDILLNYDVSYNTTSTRPEETATLHYQTQIRLKN